VTLTARSRSSSKVARIGRKLLWCGGLRTAALGIATVQREGAAVEAMRGADIVVHDVRDALDLLLQPRRLVATLRS